MAGLFRNLARRFFPNYGSGYYFYPTPTLGEAAVTPIQADTLPPVMRAVNLVAGEIARLPASVQRRTDRGWIRVDSAVSDLLEAPNDWQSGFEWRRTMVRDLMLYGNAASLIQRTRGGELLQVVPLMPDAYSLQQDETGTGYRYAHPELGTLDQGELVHFRLAGANPLWGDSPIVRGRASLDLLAEQEHAGRTSYSTGGLGKCVLSTDDPLGDDSVKALRESFAASHSNRAALGTPIIARNGLKVETIGRGLSEMEWNAARNFSIRHVAMMYGVPPAMLFADEAGTVEHTYTQIRAFVDGCLAHYAAIVAGEIGRKLLGPGERLHFDFRHLLRGSFDQVVSSCRAAIDAGCMTQNEAREMLGLPAIDGGDRLVYSKNYAPHGGNDHGGDDADD